MNKETKSRLAQINYNHMTIDELFAAVHGLNKMCKNAYNDNIIRNLYPFLVKCEKILAYYVDLLPLFPKTVIKNFYFSDMVTDDITIKMGISERQFYNIVKQCKSTITQLHYEKTGGYYYDIDADF